MHRYACVAIGVSAGGFYALSFLLEKLPEGYPFPLIVVQHRAKDPTALLEELLQKRCRITIKQADEKEPISVGTVYLAPPAYHLLVEADRTFSLSSDEHVGNKPSIDVLFESAAEVFRDKLIGIVLTGANNDGANGIVAIRRYGGLTIAQQTEEASYPMMPQAAIDTGKVDCVWSLAEIQNFLVDLPGKK